MGRLDAGTRLRYLGFMASASTPLKIAVALAADDEASHLERLRADIRAADDQWDHRETLDGEAALDELLRTFAQRHPHATE